MYARTVASCSSHFHPESPRLQYCSNSSSSALLLLLLFLMLFLMLKLPLLLLLVRMPWVQVLQVDIHPAARIGKGILLHHGIGVVIGETAVVGDNCSLLQVRAAERRAWGCTLSWGSRGRGQGSQGDRGGWLD